MIKVLRILNEPTAAGIAYFKDKQSNADKYVLIFDFGGGTLDISLLHVNNNIITVTATDGDMFLGGRDFDERTTEYLLKKYKIKIRNPKEIFKFKKAVKNAKEYLSSHPDTEFDLYSFDSEKNEETLTLEEFEAINKELIDRITIPIERLLKKINFSKEDVDSIILVGGSSNMQFVNKKLTEFFGKEPILEINPNYAVVTGAGIIASKEINNEGLPFQLRNIEFRDICPFAIGTFTNDGTFSVIIDKNKPIPAHGCERFHTVLYRQKSLSIKVYECYDAAAKNKKYLTKLDVYDLPFSVDVIWFDIDFFLDENNILKVTAKLVDDGKKYEKKIEIKRINPHSIVNIETDDDDGEEDLKNDFDLFYMSLDRFIDYNRELLESFKEINIDKIKKNIEQQQNNPDLKPIDLKSLADSCIKEFKPYFQSHPVPKFLQY